jgi:hypothetical protein
MSDEFRIIPWQVKAAGTDVPPEQVQAAINDLAFQVTIALNDLDSGATPSGPAGGDLGGTYPNPTVVAVHATSGTLDGVVIGGTTPAAGHFTTLSTTTPIPVGSGGTGAATFGAAMLTWFNSLPTTLPGSAGVLWNNGGTLAQS